MEFLESAAVLMGDEDLDLDLDLASLASVSTGLELTGGGAPLG